MNLGGSGSAICNICFSRTDRAPNLKTRVTAPTFRGRFSNGGIVGSKRVTLTIRGGNGIASPTCRISNVSNNAVASGNMSSVVGGYLNRCGGFLAGGWKKAVRCRPVVFWGRWEDVLYSIKDQRSNCHANT